MKFTKIGALYPVQKQWVTTCMPHAESSAAKVGFYCCWPRVSIGSQKLRSNYIGPTNMVQED
jgi:hypothetical protein